MAKNISHIQHIKSSVVENNKPKLPLASVLAEGEIAINFAEGYETISLKSNSGNVKTFSSDEYYTKEKLGSGFTGVNSATTVTSALEGKQDTLVSGTNIKTINNQSLLGEGNITISGGTGSVDQVIDSDTSASTNAVSTSAVYGFVTSYTPSITVDQVLDNTTSASTNPVSSKAVYDAVTDNELVWTNAYLVISGAISSHTENNNIHLSQIEKENLDSLSTNIDTISGISSTDVSNWNYAVASSHTHTNKAVLDEITNEDITNWNAQADWTESDSGSSAYILHKPTLGTAAAKGVSNGITNSDNLIEAKYIYSGVGVSLDYVTVNDNHMIQLKNTIGSVISEFNANEFIVDGMIDSVSAETSGDTTVLVITWNTDAGKEQTILDIGDIFEADNYYTKSETSGKTELENAFNVKANSAITIAGYGITDAKIENGVITLGNQTITPLTSVTFPVSSVTTSSTNGNISVNGSDVEVHGLGGAAYLNTGTTADTVAAGNHNHDGIYQPVGSYLSAITSSDVTNALGYVPISSVTTSSTDGSISVNGSDVIVHGLDTMAYEDKDDYYTKDEIDEDGRVISAALTDLDDRKLDVSAYTDLDIRVTTLETSESVMDGHNSRTTVSNLPTDKRLVIINASANLSNFSLSGNTLADGREIHVIINNTSNSSITVALDGLSSPYKVAGNDNLTIDSGKYGEINVISDGTYLYLRGI